MRHIDWKSAETILRNILYRVTVPLVLIAALAHPSAASYHMYRKPLTRSFPLTGELLSRSPKRDRPFEYRKSFAPRTAFRISGITKALPPLDLRIKPETPFDILRDGLVFEDAGSLSRDVSAAREAEYGFHGLTAPSVAPDIDLRTNSAADGAAGKIRGPLRFAFVRDEKSTPAGDPARVLGQLTDLLEKQTGLDVRNRGQASLSPGSLESLDILFLAERRSIPDSRETAAIARFLRNGGFILIDRPASGIRSGQIREEIELALAELSDEPVVNLPIEPRHPLFRAFFDLTAQDSSGYGLKGLWIGNRLAALCAEEGAPLLSVQTPEHERRLRFLVNAVVYTLTGPQAADLSGSR